MENYEAYEEAAVAGTGEDAVAEEPQPEPKPAKRAKKQSKKLAKVLGYYKDYGTVVYELDGVVYQSNAVEYDGVSKYIEL